MNPFLSLEQYLFLGTPLKITSEQNMNGDLLAIQLSPFTAFFGSKDEHSRVSEPASLQPSSVASGLDLL